MGDFTDPTAQELDRQSDGLKARATILRAEARELIVKAESLEEAARALWHRGYTLDGQAASGSTVDGDSGRSGGPDA